jgi:hypothetical protein
MVSSPLNLFYELRMKILEITITDVRYNRNGLNKIHFVAKYPTNLRRGVVVYNTLTKRFCSHIRDPELLLAVCNALGSYGRRKAFR